MSTEALCLGSELTIFTAAEVKGQLLSALDRADGLALDLSAVTDVDTAGLQVLLALRQEAGLHGKVVTICGVAPELADAATVFNLAAPLGLPTESGKEAA